MIHPMPADEDLEVLFCEQVDLILAVAASITTGKHESHTVIRRRAIVQAAEEIAQRRGFAKPLPSHPPSHARHS